MISADKQDVMYKIVGSVKSRAFRVLWLLEELGLAYEHLNFAPHSEEVLRYNPSGKVPVLVDGDAVISDSTAIMTYLADKHGGLTAKAGTLARARQDAMLHQVLDEVDAVLWAASRRSLGLSKMRDAEAIRGAFEAEYARNIDRILTQIKGPCLMGEDITIPDIVLTHCGGWAFVAKFPTDNAEFKNYLKTMRARPAYQRASALAQS